MWKFRKKGPPAPTRPTGRIDYPDGVAVETEAQRYYIKSGKKYRFTSERVFDSWSLSLATSSEASVAHIPQAPTVMGFRDGTLVMDFTDNILYLISGLKRRKVTNPDWMDRLNLNVEDAILASAKEIALHLEGEDLS